MRKNLTWLTKSSNTDSQLMYQENPRTKKRMSVKRKRGRGREKEQMQSKYEELQQFLAIDRGGESLEVEAVKWGSFLGSEQRFWKQLVCIFLFLLFGGRNVCGDGVYIEIEKGVMLGNWVYNLYIVTQCSNLSYIIVEKYIYSICFSFYFGNLIFFK